MSVFTIYCHGSGGHRLKADKEIVANFGRRARGDEYRDYLVLDGVGGAPGKKHREVPLAGSFNWADAKRGPKGNTPKELGGGTATKNTSTGRMRANAKGAGVEDNAWHAAAVIANLNPRPTTINMIGWSRGSVTAMVIANTLHDPTSTQGLFRDIAINIFAIDPVAGVEAGHGKNAETRRSIPPTVKNFLAVLATGENRQTFKPQDLSRIHVHDPNASNVAYLPFPGKHSTVAQNCDKTAADVSDIIWTLAYRFLTHFGTDHRKELQPPLQSYQAMLEAYSSIMLKKGQLDKIKQKGLKQKLIGKGFGKREFTQHLNEYTAYAAYFLNEHHRKLFKVCCPKLYARLFNRQMGDGRQFEAIVQKGDAIFTELTSLGAYPDFLTSLRHWGVRPEGKTAYALPPAGSHRDPSAIAALKVWGNLSNMGIL